MRNALSLRKGAGAMLLAAAMALVAVPAGAAANDTVVKDVEFAVGLDDGVASYPLAGAHLTIRATTDEGPEIATGVSGSDGTVVIRVTGPDTSYIVDAEWPGAQGDLEEVAARAEFNLHSDGPVAVRFRGPATTLSGTVAMTFDGHQIEDSSGARVGLLSGGIEVQSLAVAADGTYASSALPTTSTDEYSLSVTAPAGYEVSTEQPVNAAFALPSAEVGLAEHHIDRSFALIRPGGTPDPEPEPEPEPGASDPVPEPPVAPGIIIGGGLVTDPSAAMGLGQTLGGISEAQLAQLLAGASNPEGDAVVISNGHNQVIGVALAPSGAQQQQLSALVAPVLRGTPAVQLRGTSDVVALDLETMLIEVQNSRSSLQNQQLADELALVQQRNTQIGQLDTALNALVYFVSAPSDATYAAASDALRAANVEHPFLEATGDDRVTQAYALAETTLKDQANQTSTYQQLSMLRLQELARKGSGTFDFLSSLTKTLRERSASIVGNLRSTPVAIGSVQWESGTVTGAFDLSRVSSGEHHLILNFQGTGTTTISAVTVGDPAATSMDALAATGGEPGFGVLVAAAALILLGGGALVVSRAGNRRGQVTTRS